MIHFTVNTVIAIILGGVIALGLYVLNNNPEVIPPSFQVSVEEARSNLCTLEGLKYDLDYKLAPIHQRLVMESVLIAQDKGPKDCGLFS